MQFRLSISTIIFYSIRFNAMVQAGSIQYSFEFFDTHCIYKFFHNLEKNQINQKKRKIDQGNTSQSYLNDERTKRKKIVYDIFYNLPIGDNAQRILRPNDNDHDRSCQIESDKYLMYRSMPKTESTKIF